MKSKMQILIILTQTLIINSQRLKAKISFKKNSYGLELKKVKNKKIN